MPATSIFIRAASSGTSGIGYSRISVLLGPTRTAANTFSATERTSRNSQQSIAAHCRAGPHAVKRMSQALRRCGPYVWMRRCRGDSQLAYTGASGTVSDYQTALKAWQTGRNAPGEAMPEAFRIGPALKRDPAHSAALERVRGWTRERFGLAKDAAIMVAQVTCGVP